MKEITIKAEDGHKIEVVLFEAKSPKAVMLIIHGMQEHVGRYKHFAKYLSTRGITVCVGELRGHGKNIEPGKEGYSDGDIFLQILGDQLLLIEKLEKDYKLPIFVLGHSYGSFIAQRLLTLNTPASKYVIVGSSFTNTPLMKAAKVIATLGCIVPGKKKPARLIEKMSFGDYKKYFEGENWLSRDQKVWDDYQTDPLCGVSFPYSFYRSMFKNLTSNYKNIANAKKDVPIFIIAGDADPVGEFGESVKKLYSFYLKNQLPATLKLYPEARHEILNETNKEEVYSDIVEFLLG